MSQCTHFTRFARFLPRWLQRRLGLAETLEQDEFVRLAYRQVLGREADPEGLAAYISRLSEGGITPAGVMRELLASEEYRAVEPFDPQRNSPELQRHHARRDVVLEAGLATCEALDRSHYDSVWTEILDGQQKLIIGQREYAEQHRQRFFEMFNAVGLLLEEHERPRLLEFGVSEFSGFYRRLWPGLELELADRPVALDYPGFNEQRSLQRTAARAWHAVDLNQPRVLLEDQWQILHNRFQLVVFAEVLEHLTANPVEVLEQLLALLAPGGSLYLTTPNFFRRENIQRIAERDNPQEVYPAGEDNWDAHHHHREYAAREMLRFIEEAGGRCRALHYSACWDPRESEPRPEEERSNMVFVIGRRD